MTLFRGERGDDMVCKVTLDGRPVNPRFDLRNHSPAGFNWGYGGSGPAQLALAMLAALLPDDVAQSLYQDFKFAVVANLAGDEWQLEGEWILKWVEKATVDKGVPHP